MNRSKKTIWIESLDIKNIFFHIIRYLICRDIVYYNKYNLSPFANNLINGLKKFDQLKYFNEIELRLNDFDMDGVALEYRLMIEGEKITEKLTHNICRNKGSLFQRMVRVMVSEMLERNLRFTLMILGKSIPRNERNYIYLRPCPINKLISEHFSSESFKVTGRSKFVMSSHLYIRPLYYLFILWISVFMNKSRRFTNIKEPRPSQWIEFNDWTKGDRINSTFFWHNYCQSKRYESVYFIDRSDMNVQESSQQAEEQGISWVSLKGMEIAHHLDMSFFEILKITYSSLKISLSKYLWLYLFEMECYIRRNIFRKVYEKYQVKVLSETHDCSYLQGIQSQAIKDAGGILIGNYWSSLWMATDSRRLISYHVFFVWGSVMYDWTQESGHHSEKILPSGCWFQHDRQYSPELFEVREKCDFLLAVFDCKAEYNLFVSPENYRSFFKMMVHLLKENLNWGLVIKPKFIFFLENLCRRNGETELIEDFKKLENQGRIKSVGPKVSMVTVSKAADLSLGLNVSSAGIISSVKKYPVIHMDYTHFDKFFMYKFEEQKVFYSSEQKFKEAIVEYSKGNRSIGDSSKYMKLFDEFLDDQAPKRVGEFIDKFFEFILEGAARDVALNQATEWYLSKNKIDDEFFQRKNLYLREG